MEPCFCWFSLSFPFFFLTRMPKGNLGLRGLGRICMASGLTFYGFVSLREIPYSRPRVAFLLACSMLGAFGRVPWSPCRVLRVSVSSVFVVLRTVRGGLCRVRRVQLKFTCLVLDRRIPCRVCGPLQSAAALIYISLSLYIYIYIYQCSYTKCASMSPIVKWATIGW